MKRPYLLLQTYLIYETTFEDTAKEDELRELILFQWRSLFNFSIVNFGTDDDFDELEVDWDPSSNYWNIFHDLEISRSKKLAKDERLLVIHLTSHSSEKRAAPRIRGLRRRRIKGIVLLTYRMHN